MALMADDGFQHSHIDKRYGSGITAPILPIDTVTARPLTSPATADPAPTTREPRVQPPRRRRADRGHWVGPRPRADGTWDPNDFLPKTTKTEPFQEVADRVNAATEAPMSVPQPSLQATPEPAPPREVAAPARHPGRYRDIQKGLASILVTKELSDQEHDAVVAAMQAASGVS